MIRGIPNSRISLLFALAILVPAILHADEAKKADSSKAKNTSISAVLGQLFTSTQDSRIKATKISIKSLENASRFYAIEHDGIYPEGDATKMFAELIDPAERSNGRKARQYLEQVPTDAWGQSLFYEYPTKKIDGDKPAIWSAGPDKKSGTSDDITNWVALAKNLKTAQVADATKKEPAKSDADKNASKEEKAETKPKATTWGRITISGSYPEGASMPGIFGAAVQNLDTILNRIEGAASDKEIGGLILNISGAGLGWGQLNEFNQSIAKVRKAGKPVVAYLEDASTQDYVLACACDTIVMPESGAVMMLGLRAEVTFFKNLFKNIGIQADMMRVGEYKAAAEQYTREKMSPEFREEMEAVLDSYYDIILSSVSKARGIDRAKVESIIDTGPHTAAAAKELGLLDKIGYYDELKTMIAKKYGARKIINSYGKKKLDTDFSGLAGMMKMMNMMMGVEPRTRASKAPKIAIIHASGVIMSGKSATDIMGTQVMGSSTIIKAVEKAEADETVKAIVLRVDSPGGSALASDLMWRALQKCKKPIVASMGNTAASGGYYISMGAAAIYAEPGTLTGSIGVVGGKLATGGVYAKLGITTDVVSRGKNSGAFSGLSGFSDTERKAMRKLMEDIYDQFTKKAAAGRKMDHAKLEKLARGRVYTGEMAVKLNLVDKLGTLEDAVAHAKTLAGIKAGEKTERLILPKPTSPFEALFGPLGGAKAKVEARGSQALIKSLSAISPELAKTFSAASILQLIEKERRLTVMPYHLIIR